MRSQLRAALVLLAVFTVLTGIAYPLAVTGIAQAAFSRQANGDAHLIGQPFDDPKYFWGRLSATLDANNKPLPYNASASGGSNLGPTNQALTLAAKARIDALRAADPDNTSLVPVDLVTSSASGLDPDISQAAAEYQASRVARARGLEESRVRALIAEYTVPRQLGILGEARVNVALLNGALDGM
jgi:K+-transporting ATPase ATPase C chain